MEQKQNNTALIIIIFAIITIIGMILGLIFWMMSRQFALNEKLLDVRLAESQKQVAAPLQVAPTPAPATSEVAPPTPAPTTVAQPAAPKRVVKPEPKPTVKPEPKKVTPKKVVTPEPKKVAPKKVVAPEPKKVTPKKVVTPEPKVVAPKEVVAKPKAAEPKKVVTPSVKAPEKATPKAPAVTTPTPTQSTAKPMVKKPKTTLEKLREPSTAKRIAPVEKPEAPEGVDGLPLNRINLEIGNDSLEWQL